MSQDATRTLRLVVSADVTAMLLGSMVRLQEITRGEASSRAALNLALDSQSALLYRFATSGHVDVVRN
jgi:hypothetical protein